MSRHFPKGYRCFEIANYFLRWKTWRSRIMQWLTTYFLELDRPIFKFQASYVVHLLSHVQLFVTPWTVAHQASLSFTVSWSLLKLLSIDLIKQPTISSSVTPFSSCQFFSASGSFPIISWLFVSGGWSIGASALASVLPASIQGWFPLGLTGLISLFSKGLSRTFSSTTVQKHQFLLRSAFFLVQLSHL